MQDLCDKSPYSAVGGLYFGDMGFVWGGEVLHAAQLITLIGEIRMQGKFCHFRQRFIEEYFVKFGDFRILPAGFDVRIGVALIQGSRPGFLYFFNLRHLDFRLAAAADTAAGAGHDFDEGIVFESVFLDEVVDESPGIGKTADGCDVDDEMAEDDRRLLDALQAAYRFKGDEVLRCRTAGEHVVGRTNGRFHNAAGVAENTAAAGGRAKGLVELAVFQAVEVDVFFLNPLGQFPRRDTDIGIADFRFVPEEAGSTQLRTADFRFFRRYTA